MRTRLPKSHKPPKRRRSRTPQTQRHSHDDQTKYTMCLYLFPTGRWACLSVAGNAPFLPSRSTKGGRAVVFQDGLVHMQPGAMTSMGGSLREERFWIGTRPARGSVSVYFTRVYHLVRNETAMGKRRNETKQYCGATDQCCCIFGGTLMRAAFVCTGRSMCSVMVGRL